jgi:hypothetical protein
MGRIFKYLYHSLLGGDQIYVEYNTGGAGYVLDRAALQVEVESVF